MGVINNAGEGTFIIELDDDGAVLGPRLVLTRESSSPAASDDIARISLRGRNSASELIEYAYIQAVITDATDGDESGQLSMYTYNDGTLNGTFLALGGKNVIVGYDDDDPTAGPELILLRASGSPADGDLGGTVIFQGENDMAALVNYFEINMTIDDVTDTDEDATLDINGVVGGTELNYIKMTAGATLFPLPVVVPPGSLLELTPVAKAALPGGLGAGAAGAPTGSMAMVTDDGGATAFVGAVVSPAGGGTWVRMDDFTTAIS